MYKFIKIIKMYSIFFVTMLILLLVGNDANAAETEYEQYYYKYTVTDEERKALEKLVYEEARGESFEGKVAVAATVLNRYTSGLPDFDTDSIISVIIQKDAYADISGTTQEELNSVPECAQAVDIALRGYDPTREKFTETGALYFFNPKTVKGRQRQIREGIDVLEIGRHYFHVNFEKY